MREFTDDETRQFVKYAHTIAIRSLRRRRFMDRDDLGQTCWEVFFELNNQGKFDGMGLKEALAYFGAAMRGQIAQREGWRNGLNGYFNTTRYEDFVRRDENDDRDYESTIPAEEPTSEEWKKRRAVLLAFLRDYVHRRVIIKTDEGARAILAILDGTSTVELRRAGISGAAYCCATAFAQRARKALGAEVATLREWREFLDAKKREITARQNRGTARRGGQFYKTRHDAWTFPAVAKEFEEVEQ